MNPTACRDQLNRLVLMNVSQHSVMQTVDKEKIFQWIIELSNPETRENALLELSKKREVVPDLAPMLWNSFGTIAALLQEIINIYPAINPPTLTAHQSNRVCNALALLQCVASHPDTRTYFLAELQKLRDVKMTLEKKNRKLGALLTEFQPISNGQNGPSIRWTHQE